MWRDIKTDPPPVEQLVWVTNWRAFALAKRVPVQKGKKVEYQWNYRSVMLPDAVSWANRKDFENAVIPEGMEVRV